VCVYIYIYRRTCVCVCVYRGLLWIETPNIWYFHYFSRDVVFFCFQSVGFILLIFLTVRNSCRYPPLSQHIPNKMSMKYCSQTFYFIFITVINRHDAQNVCFTISISCLYMFRAHVHVIWRSKLHYTASDIIIPIGLMIPEVVKCNFALLMMCTCARNM